MTDKPAALILTKTCLGLTCSFVGGVADDSLRACG